MIEKASCTGCSACAAVCGRNAIRMQPDEDGFLYPFLDRELCVNCGKCAAVCPVSAPLEQPSFQASASLVYAREAALRQVSSSGGAFSLLAEQILAQDGVIYGCAMSDDCYSAGHIRVTAPRELEKLRGSKYVQSNAGNALTQVKADLDAGRRVLFSGTPCQVAGLKAFLGWKEWDSLLTVDVICHGVPSPSVWETYVREIEAEYAQKVTGVSFRDKSGGWKLFSLTMHLADGTRYSRPVTEDPYLRGFVGNLYLRSSCYQCPFKADGYRSDITLADFWGVEQVCPEEANDLGISLAVTHTAKGAYWLNLLQDTSVRKEVPLKDALSKNSSYFHSVPYSPLRSRVLKEIKTSGTKKTVEKYWGPSLFSRIRRKLLCFRKPGQ